MSPDELRDYAMSPDELRDYATAVILDHARDVKRLSVYEMAEQYTGGEISDADANTVMDLIRAATIAVSFPDAALPAAPPAPLDMDSFLTAVAAVSTVDGLRALWKEALASGAMTGDIEVALKRRGLWLLVLATPEQDIHTIRLLSERLPSDGAS